MLHILLSHIQKLITRAQTLKRMLIFIYEIEIEFKYKNSFHVILIPKTSIYFCFFQLPISAVQFLYVYHSTIEIITNLIDKKDKNPESVICVGLLLFSLSACLLNILNV